MIAAGFARPVDAAELQVLAPSGALPGIRALADGYAEKTGTRVQISAGAVGQVRRKFDGGQPCDLLVLPLSDLQTMEKAGRLLPGSLSSLERVSIGLGIRAGMPHPDIATDAKFRAALLAANGVVYTRPDPQHGSLQANIIAGLMERPDFAGVHGVTTGDNKGEAVSQARWDMMLTLASELPPAKDVPGVEFVGPLPESLHAYIDFAVAIPANAIATSAAKDFLAYLRRPQSAEVWREHGAEPR